MKALALFALATAVIVAVGTWIFSLVWPTAEAHRAVQASAVVALVVQLFGFGIIRLARKSNPIAAWGLTALLRMAVLLVYAFVVIPALGVLSMPALLSLATFFFLSTLVEPLLLNV